MIKFKVFKGVNDQFYAHMVAGAEPLCVQMQNGEPYLWARVQVGSPPCTTRFRVTGTGHDLGAVGRYIGTFQLHGVGSLVFHVFADA